MFKIFLTFFALLFSSSAWTAPFEGIEYLPAGSRAAIYVASEQGADIVYNSEQLLPPASTLKILTALTAKIELGDDFQFVTQLQKSDRDLFLSFSGDPRLARSDIKKLLQEYKTQHGNIIPGNLYIDDRQFTGYEKAPGWPWDNLGVCYSAPSSVVTLDDNCIQGSISSLATGQTRVYVPPHQPIEVSTDAITLTKDQQKIQHCDLELTTFGNTYRLAGCMAERSKPLPLKFAIQDTRSYVSATLRGLLSELNISLQGVIITRAKRDTPDELTLVAEHRSAPLTDLLKIMLQESDNLIADNVLKAVGRSYYQAPGSFSNGAAAMKAILEYHTKTNLDYAQFFDGSGLSRNNKITASQLAAVLEYVQLNDHTLNFIELLPKAGVDGTLKYRSSMRGDDIKGQLAAKSGSLFGSINMAGFSFDAQGEPSKWFVQLIADYHPPQSETPATPVEAPYTSFEKAFYRQLLAD
ncbi:D-alanyl-D-alanine carboxypeptidase/D-alanyl-D-alanine endopeptidase [Vibrio ulleungensis]|uniref:D-alanyl-D-alanine carboxypeptidase/D-alanyl-D-alanine-endopeptidase n=1 Tax=Vibrio ulleungensis TaxID=2807619 RepID=A0ABS2HM91_9VIBR|nr:D-alanyl-D-alanine carboxypeptidase/D-alanyl-D-alanine-endopeptidase [Vibrio ulleungensis]MBM7038605.1 D-alanyl-D-alanine carboxypeptidase/D-alanyl-D-alanine-endopeptidase [Vibrio ulleungensis]